jgi:hypothetical protein
MILLARKVLYIWLCAVSKKQKIENKNNIAAAHITLFADACAGSGWKRLESATARTSRIVSTRGLPYN